ncbi:hypothetical protein [Vallitalea guaymasensis]|uniref:hypothetical protein n=1 Tax=Vallitalea guaymasensis TaxID=1185412 RepID=UPI000DE3D676|nr:hypothetical protein [Vallitalea guaymasensis]
MFVLTKCELGKIFQKKIIYVALFLFLILSSINIYNSFQIYDYDLYSIPKDLQKPITENIFENKIKNINEGYIYGELTNSEKKSVNMYMAISDAKNNYDSLIIEKNSILEQLNTITNKSTFNYRNTKLQYEMFNKIPRPYIFNEQGWYEVVNYINQNGMLYVCILIILGISTAITSEYSTYMDSIIKSSKKGKKQFITAKIYASIIYTVIISLIFAAFNSIPYLMSLDNYGYNVPIQNIYDFIHSPYLLTIGQYLIVQFLVHLAGAIIFSLIVLLVSAICRSMLTSIFLSSSIWALPLVIEQYTYVEDKTPGIIDFSLTNIIKAAPLFRTYKTYNILGYPVLYPYLVIGIYIILVPLILYLVYYFFKNKHVQ